MVDLGLASQAITCHRFAVEYLSTEFVAEFTKIQVAAGGVAGVERSEPPGRHFWGLAALDPIGIKLSTSKTGGWLGSSGASPQLKFERHQPTENTAVGLS